MSDTGLIILGVVLLAIGIVTSFLCVGIPIAIAGFIILIYGAVKESPPMVVYPPVYPMAAPPAALCTVCGTPLQWVAQYQRWYCPRCAAYR